MPPDWQSGSGERHSWPVLESVRGLGLPLSTDDDRHNSRAGNTGGLNTDRQALPSTTWRLPERAARPDRELFKNLDSGAAISNESGAPATLGAGAALEHIPKYRKASWAHFGVPESYVRDVPRASMGVELQIIGEQVGSVQTLLAEKSFRLNVRENEARI
jgi:hypothetical protein